ncbi:MAG TPA: D-aminoacyl-tRNA deacylase [Gammaproteobacteria bacterium]|nr:D-aminoacyl-tRNA deacylase [Gammaproteobacteria bacterium]
MIAFLQRVTHASVSVDGEVVGRIGHGLMVLVAVRRDDDEARAARLAGRVLAYRVFPDAHGRMNLDLRRAGGGLLLVPQFTLAADTRRGNRPGFSHAAPPERARDLFVHMLEAARRECAGVESGRFGADMRVELVNDGPVSFWLEA